MKHLKRKIIPLAMLAFVFFFFAGIYQFINSATVQKYLFGVLTKSGLKFEFYQDDSSININFIRSRISINGLRFTSLKTNASFQASKIDLKYSPLNLLRGKLVLKKAEVEGLEASIPKAETKDGDKPKISVKKLFILQNIIVNDGTVKNAYFKFHDGNSLMTDTLVFEFKPRMTGEVALKLDLQGVGFVKDGETNSLGSLTLVGKTDLTKWYNTPPYVNAIKGSVKLQDLSWGSFNISKMLAEVSMRDKQFELSAFELVKDSKPLKGNVSVNLASEEYSAIVDIKDPIPFPQLGSSNPTIDTSGLISGSVKLNGKGFARDKNSGEATIVFKHEKETLTPIILKSSLNWKDGVISLKDSMVEIGEGVLKAEGTVNIPKKNIEIKFNGEGVPLEPVFRRFGDINFHPIFGMANATGTFSGWGKNFKVVGDGYTTVVSGYYKIKCDKASAHVDVTYDQLRLTGDIEQDGKRAGGADLTIKYGTKISGSPRPKNLHVEAEVVNINLSKSMDEYGLKGIGNAKMILNGPQRSFNSQITATIDDGLFAGIAFQKIETKADMTFKKIKFKEGNLIFPNMEPVSFNQPINIDFGEGTMRLYGTPLDYLSFDADYNIRQLSWNIKNGKYRDLTFKGIYAPLASSSLNVNGQIDATYLSVFKEYLREAEGMLDINLKYSGPVANPSLDGAVKMHGNLIYPRIFGMRMEDVEGDLKFSGHQIKSEHLTGNIEGGGFEISGNVSHENLKMQNFDIAFKGENLRYVKEDHSFRMEYDADIKWKGSINDATLTGDITILDGKYTKDFVIIEGLVSGEKTESEGLFGNDNTRLNLRVKNTGDLAIRNNIGDIWLTADFVATGTFAKPQIAGTIETSEGKIHYLGKDFIITKGVVEFRAQYNEPYLEITAEHEVPTIPDLVIIATLRGRISNLTFDLSSTKPLERKDIISLLLFGVTEQDMKDVQYSASLGPSVLASQMTYLIERPITKFTHLDIFRMEAAGGTGMGTNNNPAMQISRIYLGKQLTDRLSLEFMTDINTEDAQQTLRAEYMLTDFLLLKGERSTSENFKFNISLRFRER